MRWRRTSSSSSRFGNDRRVADAKLRRSAILGRQRQPKAQALSLQLLNDVARDYPGTPQAQLALQSEVAHRDAIARTSARSIR